MSSENAERVFSRISDSFAILYRELASLVITLLVHPN